MGVMKSEGGKSSEERWWPVMHINKREVIVWVSETCEAGINPPGSSLSLSLSRQSQP